MLASFLLLGCPPPADDPADRGSADDTASRTDRSDSSDPAQVAVPCFSTDQVHTFPGPSSRSLLGAAPGLDGATLSLWRWSDHRSSFVDLDPAGSWADSGELTSDGDDSQFVVVGDLAAGDRVVAGSFRGTVVVDPGGPTEQALVAGVDPDVVVLREESDGSVAWWRQLGAEVGGTRLRDIVSVADGGLIAALETWQGELVLGRGEPREVRVVLPKPGDLAHLVARFEPTGHLSWVQVLGYRDLSIQQLRHDEGNDRVAVVAERTSPDPQSLRHGRVFQLDGDDGNLLWDATVGGVDATANALAHGPGGDVLAGGHAHGPVDVADGLDASHSVELTAGRHAWLARFDGTSGARVWWRASLPGPVAELAQAETAVLASDDATILWAGHAVGGAYLETDEAHETRDDGLFLAALDHEGTLRCSDRVPVSPTGREMVVRVGAREAVGRWLLAGTLDGPAQALLAAGAGDPTRLESALALPWVLRLDHEPATISGR